MLALTMTMIFHPSVLSHLSLYLFTFLLIWCLKAPALYLPAIISKWSESLPCLWEVCPLFSALPCFLMGSCLQMCWELMCLLIWASSMPAIFMNCLLLFFLALSHSSIPLFSVPPILAYLLQVSPPQSFHILQCSFWPEVCFHSLLKSLSIICSSLHPYSSLMYFCFLLLLCQIVFWTYV